MPPLRASEALEPYLQGVLAQRHPEIVQENSVLKTYGGGLLNFGFKLSAPGTEDRFVRVHQVNVLRGDLNPAAHNEWSRFHKEAWALERARDLGIAVPVPLAIGYFDATELGALLPRTRELRPDLPFSYMIQRFEAGVDIATSARDGTSSQDVMLARFEAAVKEAGNIHRVATQGFGHVFDAKQCKFAASSWSAYWDEQIPPREWEYLNQSGILSSSQLKTLARRFDEMKGWDLPARLNHGDLQEWNIIHSGHRDLIADWELAFSGPAPHWDLARVIAEDPFLLDNSARFQAVRSGFGLSEEHYRQDLQPMVRTLAIFEQLSRIIHGHRASTDNSTYLHDLTAERLSSRDLFMRSGALRIMIDGP